MKNIFFIIFICFGIYGCKKDNILFLKLNEINNALLMQDKFIYINSTRVYSFHRKRDYLKKIEVNLEHNFLFKSTEVTNYNWENVMGEEVETKCGWLCAKTMNSFLDGVLIANEMSEREDLEKCYIIKDKTIIWKNGYDCLGYRLPTMAEWWTALGNYPFEVYEEGESSYLVADLSFKNQPLVASKKPNQHGIYDMHGSLREYLWDNYENHTKEFYVIEFVKNVDEDYVIIKDCAWSETKNRCSFYINRASFELNVKFLPNGIRLVRTIK